VEVDADGVVGAGHGDVAQICFSPIARLLADRRLRALLVTGGGYVSGMSCFTGSDR